MEYYDVLDELGYDLGKMLEGLEQSFHLINKEYLKYEINEYFFFSLPSYFKLKKVYNYI